VEYKLQLKYTAMHGKSIISIPAYVGNRVGNVLSDDCFCSKTHTELEF
jgi:hypothetical protein